MRRIILIIHNVRSAHNAGSLLRTADGLGIEKVIFSGYTPYPKSAGDTRLPHIANKVHAQLHKTALGAEENVDWGRTEDISKTLDELKADGYHIGILEQTTSAINLDEYQPPEKIAVILGNEVDGVQKALLDNVPLHLQIPMAGSKESFNVAAAGAMALYHLSYP